ncbi:MAG: MarR family transcriptional regulator [Desulfobacteraceae bacterium]|nr:MarR family transcriptional regulator [Desulfobacteraceae bacterium]
MDELKQNTLETFQLFLNKYDLVSKKAFDFNGVTLFPAEIHTLDFIRRRRVTYVSQIAKETGITRGAASKVTLRLKNKGLITQNPDRRNKSRQLLKTTSRGEGACEAHGAHHEKLDRQFHAFFNSLDTGRMETINSLFKMMDTWMDNYL